MLIFRRDSDPGRGLSAAIAKRTEDPPSPPRRPLPPLAEATANHVAGASRPSQLTSAKQRVEEILLMQSLTTGRGES
jgi:hypothetical protein